MKKSKELHSILDWQELKKKSINSFEIIAFKYSTRCPLNYDILDIFEKWFNTLPDDKNITIVKVDVIASKVLSNNIANETGIRHESPQVIWLAKDGTVKWNGSHFQVSKENLNNNLEN